MQLFSCFKSDLHFHKSNQFLLLSLDKESQHRTSIVAWNYVILNASIFTHTDSQSINAHLKLSLFARVMLPSPLSPGSIQALRTPGFTSLKEQQPALQFEIIQNLNLSYVLQFMNQILYISHSLSHIINRRCTDSCIMLMDSQTI